MTAAPTGTVPWPQGLTLTRWADELYLARPDWDVLPRMLDEKQWVQWADQVCQSTVLQSANTPRANNFKTWQDWATALIKSLGSQA